MRAYYQSGATRPYKARKAALQSLKSALHRHMDELHAALYTDLRKNAEEAYITETGFLLAEISHTLKHLRQWMQRERVATNLLNFPSRSFIYKEPLGVVLIIGPWNYPLQLLLAPLIGAIAAGNCAVLKPSEFAPATAKAVSTIIREVFLPSQVLVVEGDGAAVIPPLAKAFRFDHIFYTGSTQVGRSIYSMAAASLTPVTLELGGKSPCVVEADADITVTAKRIAVAKFSNAGQMCVAPDYLLVHQSLKEYLVAALSGQVRAFYSEEPAKDYHFGRIINERQFKRLVQYLGEGNILLGGKHDEGSLFIEPTLLDGVDAASSIMQEEIFGPLLPIITFQTMEEAIAIINRNPDPLAFYIFTRSNVKAEQWLERVHFGGGCVNNVSWHLTNFNLPFGGRGNSGTGAYHGKFSFDVFTHRKAVMKTPLWFDPSLKYPPFKGKINLFKKLIK